MYYSYNQVLFFLLLLVLTAKPSRSMNSISGSGNSAGEPALQACEADADLEHCEECTNGNCEYGALVDGKAKFGIWCPSSAKYCTVNCKGQDACNEAHIYSGKSHLLVKCQATGTNNVCRDLKAICMTDADCILDLTGAKGIGQLFLECHMNENQQSTNACVLVASATTTFPSSSSGKNRMVCPGTDGSVGSGSHIWNCKGATSSKSNLLYNYFCPRKSSGGQCIGKEENKCFEPGTNKCHAPNGDHAKEACSKSHNNRIHVWCGAAPPYEPGKCRCEHGIAGAPPCPSDPVTVHSNTWCTGSNLQDNYGTGGFQSIALCQQSCADTAGCHAFLYGADSRINHDRCVLWPSCTPADAYGFGRNTRIYRSADKCASCNSNSYLKEDKDKQCANKVCTCTDGTGSTGAACPNHDAAKCSSCNDGFYGTNYLCHKKICACTNGNGFKGVNCPGHGQAKCKSCKNGWHLEGKQCKKNICECSNGIGTEKTACPIHGAAKCVGCVGQYVLRADECSPWKICSSSEYEKTAPSTTADRACEVKECTCANGGTSATGSACSSHGAAKCVGCVGQFFLKDNDQTCSAWKTCSSSEYEKTPPSITSDRVCEKKVCTCANGTGATGSACPSHSQIHCTACPIGYVLSTTNTCNLVPKTPREEEPEETVCVEITNYLDAVDKTCKACAAVAGSSARTCNAAGINGLLTVTCNTAGGFHLTGTAKDNNFACNACQDQTNCAVSTADTCGEKFPTKTKCTSVTAAGFFLDVDAVAKCRALASTCTSATVDTACVGTTTNYLDASDTTCKAKQTVDERNNQNGNDATNSLVQTTVTIQQSTSSSELPKPPIVLREGDPSTTTNVDIVAVSLPLGESTLTCIVLTASSSSAESATDASRTNEFVINGKAVGTTGYTFPTVIQGPRVQHIWKMSLAAGDDNRNNDPDERQAVLSCTAHVTDTAQISNAAVLSLTIQNVVRPVVGFVGMNTSTTLSEAGAASIKNLINSNGKMEIITSGAAKLILRAHPDVKGDVFVSTSVYGSLLMTDVSSSPKKIDFPIIQESSPRSISIQLPPFSEVCGDSVDVPICYLGFHLENGGRSGGSFHCPLLKDGGNHFCYNDIVPSHVQFSVMSSKAYTIRYVSRCMNADYTLPGSDACFRNIQSAQLCAFGLRDDCRYCPRGGMCPGGYEARSFPGFFSVDSFKGDVVPCQPPSIERCVGFVSIGNVTVLFV